MSARRSATGSRTVSALLPTIALAVGVAAAVVAVAQNGTEPSTPRVAARTAVDGPVVPAPSAVSVAWYCAEGTSTVDGRATETIIVGNLAQHPIDATITVMPGSGLRSVVRHRRVDALGQARIDVADVLATPEPGVVVEIVGGPAIVEHELQSRGDIAVGPCAREPSTDWYFAEGTTQRGAEEWLVLFNPFGDDAIVDISFLTDVGFQAPGSTQAFVVPRRSRVSLPVHEQVLRQERVAIAVHARTGRIVAERSLRFDGSTVPQGLAVSLGVTGFASRWRIPFGDAQTGASESVSIANFQLVPTAVDVNVLLDGDEVLQPRRVKVPARGVVRVDLSERVPAGSGYSVDVRVTRATPVVVEAFGTWATPASVTGVATAPASVATAKQWAFAVGRTEEAGDAVVTAVNVSGRPLTVQLYAYTAGNPNSPSSAPAQAVPPGERAIFRLSELGVRADMVFVVSADGPIIAGREALGATSGVSLSPGVPELS